MKVILVLILLLLTPTVVVGDDLENVKNAYKYYESAFTFILYTAPYHYSF